MFDPIADQVGLSLGEGFPFIGHDIVVIFRENDTAIEVAFFEVARDDGLDIAGAFEDGLFLIEPEFAFLFFRTVAFDAGFLENRDDILDEIDFIIRAQRECAEGQQADECKLFHMLSSSAIGTKNKQMTRGLQWLNREGHRFSL